MPLTEQDYVDLTLSLTANGVPPTAIANSLDLPIDLVKELISDVRIGQYGSDEISEVVMLLMWEAFEQTLEILRHGRPADRLAMTKGIMGRAMAVTSKQEPETITKMREVMMGLVGGVREGTGAKIDIYTEDPAAEYRVGRQRSNAT